MKKTTGVFKTTTLVVLAAVSLSLFRSQSHRVSGRVSDEGHPRLMITPQTFGDLSRSAETSHKHLFELAMLQADEFAGELPGEALNAGNRNRRIGESLPSLGLAYMLTREERYLEGAERWIRAMLAVESWQGSQNLGRSAWITGLAQVYDWLYQDLDDDLKKRMIIRIKKEAGIVVKTASSTRALSNHLMIETSAIGSAGLILEAGDPVRERLLEQANEWAEYIIHNAPLDGSWGEGVQYWQYGLGYFLRYLEGAHTSGTHDYFKEYGWLRKTGRFPLHFSVPDRLTRVINFSDCRTDSYLPACMLYLVASKYRDGVVQDFALKIQASEPHKFSWFDFLAYDASVEPVDFRNVESTFHHFEDHGFVTMRSSWEEDATLVGFRCGPGPGHANQAKPERLSNRGYGPGHQHPDINHFVVYANGTWLAIDPGYSRVKDTRNHSTLIVNGQGQAGAGEKWLDYMAFQNREPAPRITFAESTEDFDYVIGNAGNIYVDDAGLEYFERQLMFVRPDIILIADRLRCKASSTYEWLLQANQVSIVERVRPGYLITKPEASLSVVPLFPPDHTSRGSERPVEAWDVHGSPDHNEYQAILKTIEFKTYGMQAEYLVVLTVNKPGDPEPEITMNGDLVRIEKNGREILVTYHPVRDIASKILDYQGPG